jgi:hypothetical protein
MGARSLELPVNPVQREHRSFVWNGDAPHLASTYAVQSQEPHQPRHSATRIGYAASIHLVPNFVRTINLHVGLPNALNVGEQYIIALGPAQRSW